MNRNQISTWLSLAVLVCAYAALFFWKRHTTDIGYYLLNLIPLYIVYFILVYKTLKTPEKFAIPIYWFIVIAALIRLIVILNPVFLSDDIYRYIWDGRMSAQGINPYSYPPAHENLFSMRDNEIYPNINFPEISTIYPPIAQLLFLINAWTGDSILSWKIMLFAAEIVLILVLYRLTVHFSLSPYRLLIVLFNPLLIIETYQSGHLDLFGILFFWIAVLFFYQQKNRSALISFLAAALIKVLPLVACIPFLQKNFWRKYTLLILLFIFFIIPFSCNGTIPMSGFFSYANRWAFNNIFYITGTEIFRIIGIPVLELFHLTLNGTTEIFYLNSALVYKVLVILIIIAAVTDQMRKLKVTAEFRSINFLQFSFFITGLVLLLSPTLHPWYVLWIIPFLIFTPKWSWLFFTFLIQLSYFILSDYAQSGIWKENVWIVLAEFVPFIILMLYEHFDRRTIRGWFLN